MWIEDVVSGCIECPVEWIVEDDSLSAVAAAKCYPHRGVGVESAAITAKKTKDIRKEAACDHPVCGHRTVRKG